MVNRSNYRLFKSYLGYLRSQAQLNDLSIERYWSYGKHLLLWAGETPFSSVWCFFGSASRIITRFTVAVRCHGKPALHDPIEDMPCYAGFTRRSVRL